MISLLVSPAVLVIGFFVYGKVVEKVFSPDDRQTPAVAINDGVAAPALLTVYLAVLIRKLHSERV